MNVSKCCERVLYVRTFDFPTFIPLPYTNFWEILWFNLCLNFQWFLSIGFLKEELLGVKHINFLKPFNKATLLSPNLEPVFSPTHVFRECLFHQTLVNSRDYSLKYLQCLFAFVWLVEKWNIIMEGKIMESSFPHFSNELGHICL